MTRGDVIRWAREAGFQTGVVHGADGNPVHPLVQPIGSGCVVELERFAALVAAAVRHTPGVAQMSLIALEQERARGRREGAADEREACAKACDEAYYKYIGPEYGEVRLGIAACATAIRARSTP